jgi:hypothetical protein
MTAYPAAAHIEAVHPRPTFMCTIYHTLHSRHHSDKDKHVEDSLQAWSAGKQARRWLTLQLVATKCAAVTLEQLHAYCKLGRNPHLSTARSYQLRGLAWEVTDKKVTHLFILDRTKEEAAPPFLLRSQTLADDSYEGAYHAGDRDDYYQVHVTSPSRVLVVKTCINFY